LADRVLSGERLDEVVADYFGTVLRAATRFEDFVERRWDSLDVVKEAADHAFFGVRPEDSLLAEARAGLIIGNGGLLSFLQPVDVDSLNEGFADAFRARLAP
jgi:hypothetical protein